MRHARLSAPEFKTPSELIVRLPTIPYPPTGLSRVYAVTFALVSICVLSRHQDETTDWEHGMSMSELERLKKLGELTDQISGMADSDAEVLQSIARLISRAEEDIKVKTREIQLQKTQIGLLKHILAALDKPKAQAGGGGRIPGSDQPDDQRRRGRRGQGTAGIPGPNLSDRFDTAPAGTGRFSTAAHRSTLR